MNEIEDDEIERMTCFSHWAGKAAGLEEFERHLKEIAATFFKNGHDEKANLVRELAKDAGKTALDHRKRQKDYEKKFSGGL